MLTRGPSLCNNNGGQTIKSTLSPFLVYTLKLSVSKLSDGFVVLSIIIGGSCKAMYQHISTALLINSVVLEAERLNDLLESKKF